MGQLKNLFSVPKLRFFTRRARRKQRERRRKPVTQKLVSICRSIGFPERVEHSVGTARKCAKVTLTRNATYSELTSRPLRKPSNGPQLIQNRGIKLEPCRTLQRLAEGRVSLITVAATLTGHALFCNEYRTAHGRRASVSRLAGFHSSNKTADFQRTDIIREWHSGMMGTLSSLKLFKSTVCR
jgi:hypothetical protein